MTDRELLELAAKAAMVEFDFCRLELGGCQVRKGLTSGWWNPLTDDGDALRLAVRLRMRVNVAGAMTAVVYYTELGADSVEVLFGSDMAAATRRAIVRAAAEIGRTL